MNSSILRSFGNRLSSRVKVLFTFNSVKRLEDIREPPRVGNFELKYVFIHNDIRNTYIPLTKRTLLREILQDNTLLSPSNKDIFEKVVIALDRKIAQQYTILQHEIAQLYDHQQSHGSSLTPDMAEEDDQLDHQFDLLRRVTELVSLAGFSEITKDQLDCVCQPRETESGQSIDGKRINASPSFIDPGDYDVLRFWIRGFHPANLVVSPVPSRPDLTTGRRLTYNAGRLGKSLWLRIQSLRGDRSKVESSSTDHGGLVEDHTNQYIGLVPRRPDDSTLGRVLMAVQTAPGVSRRNDLMVKLFQNVPVGRPKRRSFMFFSSPPPSFGLVDNLRFLLPHLRLTALSRSNRQIVIGSSGLAALCLFVVAPLVGSSASIAWPVAASALSSLVGLGVWANHKQGQLQLANWIVQLHYECSYNFGAQSLLTLLKLAQEEDFKKVLLTYALLLSSSEESKLPIKPVQLNIRAETWLAKRINGQNHISMRQNLPSSSSVPLGQRFSGGSGPGFDLEFNVSRPLQLLTKFDLVHGDLENAPRVQSLNYAAVNLVQSGSMFNDPTTSSLRFSELSILDSLLASDRDLGSSSTSTSHKAVEYS